MSPAEINKINSAINTALQKNYRLRVQVISPRDPQSGQAQAAGKQQHQPVTASNNAVQKVREASMAEREPGVQIGPATVTADASYNAHDGFTGTVSFSFSC